MKCPLNVCHTGKSLAAFILSFMVLLWGVWVIAAYAADRVTAYVGSAPMAFDTAVCISVLAVVGMILAKRRIRDIDE